MSRVARHAMDPLERTIRLILLGGVALSVALMGVGVVASLARGEGLPHGVTHVGDITAGLGSLDSAAYLSLGLIVLIGTPFVRVAGSLVAFAREHDRRYTAITATVLAVMCLSVLLGRA